VDKRVKDLASVQSFYFRRHSQKTTFKSMKILISMWSGLISFEKETSIDDIILVLQQNRLRWYGHVL